MIELKQTLPWSFGEQVVIDPAVYALLIVGHTGTGKTELTRLLEQGHPHVITKCCESEMSTYELFGQPILKDGNSSFQMGPAALAWTYNDGQGCPLILDEIEKTGVSGQEALLCVSDARHIARFCFPDGRIIKPGPDFRLVCTANSVEPLSEPLLNRLTNILYYDTPNPKAIAKLSDDLQKLAEESCTANAKRPKPYTLRQWFEFDRARERYGVENAAKLVFNAEWRSIVDHLKIAGRPGKGR